MIDSLAPSTAGQPVRSVAGFYEAFARLDGQAMADTYAVDATFDDPVFSLRGRDEIGAMWQMLCEAIRNTDVQAWSLEFDAPHEAGNKVCTRWAACYRFSGTGRLVRNVIDAQFEFDGPLVKVHRDRFDFWRWSRQALGVPGLLLGWSAPMRAKVRQQAARNLSAYREKSR